MKVSTLVTKLIILQGLAFIHVSWVVKNNYFVITIINLFRKFSLIHFLVSSVTILWTLVTETDMGIVSETYNSN